jgi:hypothetical protein
MTNERFLTPPKLAKLMGVSVEKIAEFIRRGELIAINTSLTGGRPRWKIEPAAFRQFLESRSNKPPQEVKPRRRKPIPTPTKQYV